MLKINSREYPVKSFTRESLSEYATAIREGQVRRVDRQFADFREEGTGYPRGLGYRRGRPGDVDGGLWKAELRCEIPGQITLPLEMESQSINLGDLSGEETAAGRFGSINTDLGNSSGLKRLFGFAGTKLWRTVSDTDFTIEDSGWTIPTGSARIYCIAEITLNSTRYLALGLEDPTSGNDSALIVTANPTASPPVFSKIQGVGGGSDGEPDEVYWIVSIDAVSRTYFHYRSSGDGSYPAAGEYLAYMAYSDALTAVPTTVAGFTPRKGDQLAGVIGTKLFLIEPDSDAQANEDAVKGLGVFDINTNKYSDLNIGVRTVVLACRYEHPTFGTGIAYTDGKQVRFINGSSYQDFSLGWFRHQGRDVACSIRGLSPKNERLFVLVQADANTSAWWECYIPKNNEHGGCWYPWSKRVSTSAQTILPGGTPRGTTMPWGAEGLRHYVIDPSATNSTVWKQKEYAYHSNPLTDSVGVDDFEDGPLAAEFPMMDTWGGPEETGIILGAYFEGDANVTATETALWEYTTDQSTYPDFATYTAADTTTTLATGGAAARRFGTRVTLDRGATATTTPNGAPFVVRGLKEPSTRYTWSFVLDTERIPSVASARSLISYLETARDATAAVLLEYGNVKLYVYVARLSYTFAMKGGSTEESLTQASVSVVEVL